jgi:hypothetical protein
MHAGTNTMTTHPQPTLTPAREWFGTHRQHTLTISTERLKQILADIPQSPDDPHKVVNSWRFLIDGHPCAVWDYKGSHKQGLFSAYGPADKLRAVFGDAMPETSS